MYSREIHCRKWECIFEMRKVFFLISASEEIRMRNVGVIPATNFVCLPLLPHPPFKKVEWLRRRWRRQRPNLSGDGHTVHVAMAAKMCWRLPNCGDGSRTVGAAAAKLCNRSHCGVCRNNVAVTVAQVEMPRQPCEFVALVAMLLSPLGL